MKPYSDLELKSAMYVAIFDVLGKSDVEQREKMFIAGVKFGEEKFTDTIKELVRRNLMLELENENLKNGE